MAGSLKNIGLTSLDDLFKTDEQRQADAQERVQIVPADQVFPYAEVSAYPIRWLKSSEIKS